jgi:hypothetical protein
MEVMKLSLADLSEAETHQDRGLIAVGLQLPQRAFETAEHPAVVTDFWRNAEFAHVQLDSAAARYRRANRLPKKSFPFQAGRLALSAA